MKEKIFAIIVAALIAILIMSISFFGVACIIYLLSFCFGFHFTWKLALGIWLILLLINMIIPDKK